MRSTIVLLAALLLAAATLVSATFFVVQPVDTSVESGDVLALGKLSPGQSVDVHIEKKSGLDFKWARLSVSNKVPPGVSLEIENQPEIFIIHFSTSREASFGDISVPLVFYGPSGESQILNLQLTLLPPTAVQTISLESLDPQPELGVPFRYRMIINNDGLDSDTVRLTSNQADYWFSPTSFLVPAGQKVEQVLVVTPRVQGERRVEFLFSSDKTGLSQSFFFTQTVPPGVPESFFNAFFGHPFFTPPLAGFYWLDGFLAHLG